MTAAKHRRKAELPQDAPASRPQAKFPIKANKLITHIAALLQ